MKITLTNAVSSLLLAWTIAGTAAAVPLATPIQGTLTTNAGIPVTTPTQVEFKVFQGGQAGTAGSGTMVFDEFQTISPGPNGTFTAMLGSGVPNGSFLVVNGVAQANAISTGTYDTSMNVFVEVSFAGTTLLPRLPLASVPYAVISIMAANVAAANVTPGTLQSGVLVPAASILAGNLNSGVVAAAVAANTINSDSQVATGANISEAKIANLPADLANRVRKTGDAMTGPLATSSTMAISGQNAGGIGLSVTAGVTVGGTLTAQYLVGDGHLISNVSASQIAAGSITPGTLQSGVFVPAANIQAGNLSSGVQINASGLVNGPVAAAMIPANVAWNNANNNFTAPQTNTAAAPTAPSANTQYANNMVKAYVTFNGYTGQILDSFNVASIRRNSAGNYTVTWATPFANPYYAVSCGYSGTPDINVCQIGAGGTITVGTVGITINNPQYGWAEDGTYIAITATGKQ